MAALGVRAVPVTRRGGGLFVDLARPDEEIERLVQAATAGGCGAEQLAPASVAAGAQAGREGARRGADPGCSGGRRPAFPAQNGPTADGPAT
jgi:hypothetical protein